MSKVELGIKINSKIRVMVTTVTYAKGTTEGNWSLQHLI
jgi:hypothetical protein